MKVDRDDPSTLDPLFAELPDLDAVVCFAANGPLVDLVSATEEEIAAGTRGKLLGQVALARRALRHLPDGGSVTLTGGTFSAPLAGASLGALINAGFEGFVRNTTLIDLAAELPNKVTSRLLGSTSTPPTSGSAKPEPSQPSTPPN